MKTEITMSLAEVKSAIKANLGTPQSNQNAATALAGQRFLAENAKGECVLGVVLGQLSAKGKVQATLACSHVEKVDGEDVECTETHVREQSDWHQSLKCRTHALASKAKLTDAEKQARLLQRAQATVAKLGGAVAVQPMLRSGPTLDAMRAAGEAA